MVLRPLPIGIHIDTYVWAKACRNDISYCQRGAEALNFANPSYHVVEVSMLKFTKDMLRFNLLKLSPMYGCFCAKI